MYRKCQQTFKNCQPLDYIDVEGYTPKTAEKANELWVKNDLFTLTKEDKSIPDSQTTWLTDTIIDAAQKLLKQKVWLKNGFQDVCCGRTYAFDIESSEFTQVLHTGHGHWITVSTIGTQEAEALTYDSMHPSISSSDKRQSAALLATNHNKITLKNMDVQMQSGPSGCGLFAIAFATVIVHGEHPGKLCFNEDSMRQHLIKCLERGEMTIFSIKKTRPIGGHIKSEDVRYWNVLLMPHAWDPQHGHDWM